MENSKTPGCIFVCECVGEVLGEAMYKKPTINIKSLWPKKRCDDVINWDFHLEQYDYYHVSKPKDVFNVDCEHIKFLKKFRLGFNK